MSTAVVDMDTEGIMVVVQLLVHCIPYELMIDDGNENVKN
jgi:hypothetical protein